MKILALFCGLFSALAAVAIVCWRIAKLGVVLSPTLVIVLGLAFGMNLICVVLRYVIVCQREQLSRETQWLLDVYDDELESPESES
jgi:hypothetical protein